MTKKDNSPNWVRRNINLLPEEYKAITEYYPNASFSGLIQKLVRNHLEWLEQNQAKPQDIAKTSNKPLIKDHL